ncbi:MAG: hypothetical protein OER88_11945 [Planctomycetota bacterium]|nr:hypothetical protein [Planctomycetota bacterium]
MRTWTLLCLVLCGCGGDPETATASGTVPIENVAAFLSRVAEITGFEAEKAGEISSILQGMTGHGDYSWRWKNTSTRHGVRLIELNASTAGTGRVEFRILARAELVESIRREFERLGG